MAAGAVPLVVVVDTGVVPFSVVVDIGVVLPSAVVDAGVTLGLPEEQAVVKMISTITTNNVVIPRFLIISPMVFCFLSL